MKTPRHADFEENGMAANASANACHWGFFVL
jgi:hypothetical protein